LPEAALVASHTIEGKETGSLVINGVNANVYSFDWSNGQTGRQIVNLSAGDYCITISERDGTCELTLCETIESTTPDYASSIHDGELKILFIGNSHTIYFDLPAIVEQMIANQDPDQLTFIDAETAGGYAFRDHLESGRAETFINKTNWDYVVLQENADVASFTREEAEKHIYPYARSLANLIADNNPATQIILYLTHAYKSGSSRCDVNPSVCDCKGMQNEIRRNYEFVSGLFKSNIAPAGIMWKMIQQEHDINLHDNDEVHPNIMGSVISAATICATIQNKRLTTAMIPADIFTENEASEIVDIINGSLFDYNPNWRTF